MPMLLNVDLLVTQFDHFTEFREVSIEHLQLVWHANRRHLIPRAQGPVQFGTDICSSGEISLSHLRTRDFEYPSVLFYLKDI